MNVIRIVDADGCEGLASTWLPGGRHEVADAVAQFLRPLLVGRRATEREALWHAAQQLGYFTSVRAAISATDIALWDLAAKEVELPLCDLLGRRRDRLPAYASALPQPSPAAAATAGRAARD